MLAWLLPRRRLLPMIHLLLVLSFLPFLPIGFARDAPQNLRSFYDGARANGRCSHELATGFYSTDSGPNTFSYCGDHLDSAGILYIQGRNGALANMDVDCDGATTPTTTTAIAPPGSNGTGLTTPVPGDDGRCRQSLSPDSQNTTTFRDTVASYNRGIADLNPYVHAYVVLGNAAGTRGRPGWRAFDPSAHGVRPLSAAAVVCPGYKLFFGVWGDTNGDDGPKPMVGEASLAMATFCGGQGVNGSSGIDADEILYIAFRGEEAVPGPDGADWAAKDPGSFESSLEDLGMRLVARVPSDAGKSGSAGSLVLGWLDWKAPAIVLVLIAVMVLVLG